MMKRYTRGTLDESVRAVFRRLNGAEPTTVYCCWDSQLMDHSTRETGMTIAADQIRALPEPDYSEEE